MNFPGWHKAGKKVSQNLRKLPDREDEIGSQLEEPTPATLHY